MSRFDRRKAEIYLGRVLPLAALLAALGPGMQALKMFRAREFARTFREYGSLPEVRVSPIDYVILSLAVVLLAAAVLQLFRVRVAAPLALGAVGGLWLYYVPAIWEEITGNMWFAMKLGRNSGLTWQMLTYQISATLCAAMVTRLAAQNHSK